jgi:hypothetical protein
MEACENSPDLVLGQIRARWREQMRASLHSGAESVLLQIEANGGHFSDGQAAVEHHVAPLVHDLGPLREVGGAVSGWVVRPVPLGPLADSPEIPPFSVLGLMPRLT